LHGSSVQGGALTFAFQAPSIPDLQQRAQIVAEDSSSATFQWTPQTGDVGSWQIQFSVSDGVSQSTATVTVTVSATGPSCTQPVFPEPTGNGTTLDLSQKSCEDLDVVVQDDGAAGVTIAQEDPKVDGATLQTTGSFTATWHWCPTQDQITARDRYAIQLSASDAGGGKALRPYIIILQRPSSPTCTGSPPVITHTPQDAAHGTD